MTQQTELRPPLPPFTRETAIAKVRKAEDAWNSRDPAKVALGLHRRQPLAKPQRYLPGPRRDRRIPDPQMGGASASTA